MPPSSTLHGKLQQAKKKSTLSVFPKSTLASNSWPNAFVFSKWGTPRTFKWVTPIVSALSRALYTLKPFLY